MRKKRYRRRTALDRRRVIQTVGKGTDLISDLRVHPLSWDEVKERQIAEEISDPDIEVTLEGDLVKRPRTKAVPRVVQKPQTATWD
jgi:hypothetical protein